MSVGQPEMKRNDGCFGQVSDDDQQKCEQHQRIGMRAQRSSDLRKIQRACPGIKQADAHHDHECANGIYDGEIECSLQRSRFECFESAERECRNAHQFEKNEQIK